MADTSRAPGCAARSVPARPMAALAGGSRRHPRLSGKHPAPTLPPPAGAGVGVAGGRERGQGGRSCRAPRAGPPAIGLRRGAHLLRALHPGAAPADRLFTFGLEGGLGGCGSAGDPCASFPALSTPFLRLAVPFLLSILPPRNHPAYLAMPPAPGPSASAPPAAKSTGQNVRKKRTAVSCDRCKNRKTKVRAPAPPLDTDGPPLTLRRGASAWNQVCPPRPPMRLARQRSADRTRQCPAHASTARPSTRRARRTSTAARSGPTTTCPRRSTAA